jgi:folate-binding protein YgfZ
VAIALPSPHVIEIAGNDALAFAQAQFSSDVGALAPGRWQWSAWLSAQGRVRAIFRLLCCDAQRLLLVRNGGTAAALIEPLSRYVLRARVAIRPALFADARGWLEPPPVPGSSDVGADRFVAAGGWFVLAQPDLAGRRWYAFGNASSDAPAATQSLDAWRAADIVSGLAGLGDAQAERFLPAWLGLERLGAVSVRKGCYPGQEIVARLHFKGGNKRWLHRLDFAADTLPEPGTILGDGDSTGEMLDSAWIEAPSATALAVLPAMPAGSVLTSPASAEPVFRVVRQFGPAND